MSTASQYHFAGADADGESQRLSMLEAWLDPITGRRLGELDLPAGGCALEVGAGRGSVARMLAARLGPAGRVVAVDIDPRFLTAIPGVEVRRLDVRVDSPEADTFDLVHCRFLLMHLPDPLAALRRLVNALRPGGVILLEEADGGMLRFAGHPDADWATETTTRAMQAMAAAKIADSWYGRRLPADAVAAGLEVIGGDAIAPLATSGHPAFELVRLTAITGGPGMVASGVITQDELTRLTAVFEAPSLHLLGYATVCVSARRIG